MQDLEENFPSLLKIVNSIKFLAKEERKELMKKDFDAKWSKTFKDFNSLGKSGVVTGNAVAIEVNGVIYETLKQAKEETGKSLWWLKKHGKVL